MSRKTVVMGHEDHYRISLRTRVERVLGRLGTPVRLSQVFFVGIPAPGHTGHTVVVPEGDVPSPDHLHGLSERAHEAYESHPLRHMLHADHTVHDLRQDYIRRTALAEAVENMLNESGAFDGVVKTLQAVRRGTIELVAGLVLPRQVTAAVPELASHELGTARSSISLLDSCLRVLSSTVGRDLMLDNPGPTSMTMTAREVRAQAADDFFRDALYRAGTYLSLHRDKIDMIAKSTYEQEAASGRIVVARKDHPALRILTGLVDPVPMAKVRHVRKLLETSGPEVALLVDDGQVHGLGDYEGASIEDPDDDVMEIVFVGHARWELRHHMTPLMTVDHGQPRFPRPGFDVNRFEDIVGRCLGPSADAVALCGLVDASLSIDHGSTLVFSHDAAGEALRLGGEAFVVEPRGLTPELLVSLSRVDGAFLLDEQAVMHAFGVILDGRADLGLGDPARGSRYNSAMRYKASREADSVVIVVISDDGGIDFVPDLPPRVSRQLVEDAVLRLEEMVKSGDAPGQSADAVDDLRDLSRYLTPEQARRANQALGAERSSRRAAGGMEVMLSEFVVSDDPSDELFYPEK